jgi:hypothetical protein
MKKCDDEDVIKKHAELEGKQDQKFITFLDFRKQFDEYLRSKTGKVVSNKSIGRPHTEIFRQPEKK